MSFQDPTRPREKKEVLFVFKRNRGMLVAIVLFSALGVILRRLLCEHSRPIAYPAAKVQTGDAQSNQTMPCLQDKGAWTYKCMKSILQFFFSDFFFSF